MTADEAIRILTKHVDSFLSGTGKYIFVLPQEAQDLFAACQIATDALKKDIPVQPVREFLRFYTLTRCPTCGFAVYNSDWDLETKRARHINICFHCGQRFTEPLNEFGFWQDVKNCEEDEE